MNSNKKRWIILLVAVIAIAIVVILATTIGRKDKEGTQVADGQEETVNEEKYTEELGDGTKLNTSEEFNSTKKYKKLEIRNIQYTSKEGMTVLLADVKNRGSKVHKPEIVKIEILDEEGKVITEGKPVIEEIEPGETIKLNTSLIGNVANAKDFRITEIK